jgi:hypothetical protein
MASGDKLYIEGDSDINPGQQAQYQTGYDDVNSGAATPSCNPYTKGAYNCDLAPPPAGISSLQMTSIIGIGTHQPQLWGNQGIWWVLNLTTGNLDIENLEITQHDSCSGIALTDSGADGFPAYCGGTSGSYPYGPWTKYGVWLSGANLITKNLYVHRIALDDIWFPSTLTNWSSTNDIFTSSGESIDNGVSTGGSQMAFAGNNSLTGDVWAWGGCLEHYPSTNPNNIKLPSNYVHCADQNNSGLGGGFMQQASSGACGNWTISNSQFLFNLKTNIDFLHCSSGGTFNFYRSRSEGSSGETLKVNNFPTVNIEESQLIGNAPVWSTSQFTAITPVFPIICRGGAVSIFGSFSGEQVNFINDDITGNCNALINVSNLGQPSGTTCPGMSINTYNTKLVGGWDYGNGDNVLIEPFYNAGNDGNGGGGCGTGTIPFNMTNDSCYNSRAYAGISCSSGINTVTSDPLIYGETYPNFFTNYLGPNSYYNGTSLGDLFYLQSLSPLRTSSTNSAIYTNSNGSNDYNGYAATDSPVDIGAIQYNSCILTSTGNSLGFCSINSQCCATSCNSNGYCLNSISPVNAKYINGQFNTAGQFNLQ